MISGCISKFTWALLAMMTLVAWSGAAALAAEYPVKPVRLLVPFSADGGADMQAQALAEPLRRNLGQQVLVEHRAGAGGLIGGEVVAQSPADGHTLLLTSASLAVNASWLAAQMPFSALVDLAPVSLVSAAPLVLAVHPAVPAKSVPELVALAKRARPMIRAGGNAPGSLGHVAVALFSHAAGCRVDTALFNGGGPAARALAGGELDTLFIAAPVAVSHLAAQHIRALAITAAEAQPRFAGVPALQGFYPGLVIENWYALLAPARTPQAVVARLHSETRRALVDEDVREFLISHGLTAVGGAPDALGARIKSEMDRYAGQLHRGELHLQ